MRWFVTCPEIHNMISIFFINSLQKIIKVYHNPKVTIVEPLKEYIYEQVWGCPHFFLFGWWLHNFNFRVYTY
jgi:hypothetical protein